MRRIITVTAVGVLFAAVAACGAGPAPPSGPPSSLGGSEGVVRVLAWPGYVEDGGTDRAVDWVGPFRRQTGCQVQVKTFGTSDEAVALMGTGAFDVLSASGDASLRLIEAGEVEPINTALIPSYPDLYPFLRDKPWNSSGGQTFGIPHGWGANVMMYRTDVVSPVPDSWRAVFDDAPRYAGRVTAYDSPIYLADAALYLMRHRPELAITDPYALDRTQFAAAVDLLKRQRASIGSYWNDIVHEVQSFSAGATVIGTSWQVGANLARDGGTPVATVLPVEGSTGWTDSWMISSRTSHRDCAYRWIQYVVSPGVNAQIAEYFGEAPANPKACPLMTDPRHCATYRSGDAEYSSQIWYWTTPMKRCVDGRTDTECVDYAAWSKAWLQIKG